MSETILVAIISGGLALLGTVSTCIATSRKSDERIRISQAVTETKIDELTREVRRHNNFAERIPTVEEKIVSLNQRLDFLERNE